MQTVRSIRLLCFWCCFSLVLAFFYLAIPHLNAAVPADVSLSGLSGSYEQGFICNGSGSVSLSLEGMESISFSLYAASPVYAAPAVADRPGPYVLGDNTPSASGAATLPVYVSNGTLWIQSGGWLEAVYEESDYFETFFVDRGTAPSSPQPYPFSLHAEGTAGASDVSFSMYGSGSNYTVSATLPAGTHTVTLSVATPDHFATSNGGSIEYSRDPKISMTGWDIRYTQPAPQMAAPAVSAANPSAQLPPAQTSSLPDPSSQPAPSSQLPDSSSASASSGDPSQAASNSSKESSSTSRTYAKPKPSSSAAVAAEPSVEENSTAWSTHEPPPASVVVTQPSVSTSTAALPVETAPAESEIGYLYRADTNRREEDWTFGTLYLVLVIPVLLLLIFHRPIRRFFRAVYRVMQMDALSSDTSEQDNPTSRRSTTRKRDRR